MRPINFHIRLIISIALFVVTVLAIFFGIRILRSYVSESFVVEHSIKNIMEESENSSKTERIISKNEAYLEELQNHAIASENDVPLIVEEIESYADKLGLISRINSISFPDIKAKKSKPPTEDDIELSKKQAEKSATANGEAPLPVVAAPKPQKPLTIDIAVRGDFTKLVSFIKVVENGKYIIQIPAYSLRQVVVTPPSSPGGDPILVELKDYNSTGQPMVTTWLLSAQLVVYTRIP